MTGLCFRPPPQSYMENVVLDVADLDAGVLRRRAVDEQRLEPAGSRKELSVCSHESHKKQANWQ